MKKYIKILLTVSILFTCLGLNLLAEEQQIEEGVFNEDTTLTGWHEYSNVVIGDGIKVQLVIDTNNQDEPAGLVIHGSFTIGNGATLIGAEGAHLVFDDAGNISGAIDLYNQEGTQKIDNLDDFMEFEYDGEKWKQFIPLQEELSEGLYVCFDIFGEASPWNVSKELETFVGQNNGYSFYYYNGSSFVDVDENELTTSNDLDYSIETWNNEEMHKNAQVFCIYPKTVGEYAISYNGYTIPLHVLMPEIGLYTDNEATVDNLVTNLFQYDISEEFYVLTSLDDDWNIESWKIITFTESGETDFTDYTFNDSTKKLTFDIKPDGDICIKYTVKNISTEDSHENNIMIQNHGEGGHEDSGDRKAHIDYNGNTIEFGAANYSEDANLHITDVHGFNSSEELQEIKLYLAAGIIQAATAQVANQEIYDGISNAYAEIENSSFEDGGITASIGENKESYCGVGMWPININIAANATGNADIKISFDLTLNSETQHLVTYVNIDVRDENIYDFNINNMDDFNDCFSSYSKFLEYANDVPEDVTRINVFLPEGSYSGEYKVNFKDYNVNTEDFKELIFYGHRSENDGQWMNNTLINGTLTIEGGFITVNDIEFSANSDITKSESDLGIENKTFGIIAKSSSELPCGAYFVNGCDFFNYDYAVCSTYSGLICDINNDYFSDCEHAYYMDCNNNHLNIGGDSSSGNTFNNCKYGVSIVSTPENLPAYSLRFKDNYFYHDGDDYADFYIRQNDGTFYFQKNYYGKSEDGRFSDDGVMGMNVYKDGESKGQFKDLRTVKIDLGTCNSAVITNPCIRYSSVQHINDEWGEFDVAIDVLGIDPAEGLNFRIFSESRPENRMQIDARDVINIKNMGISGSDGQEDFGSFDFSKEGE